MMVAKREKRFYLWLKRGLYLTRKRGRLRLINGNRQEKDLETGKPSILYFDRYVIEAKDNSASVEKGGRFLRAYERSIGDLLNPQEALSPSARLEFVSAAHQRLISPLYALVFGLLGVCAMILGHFNRKGRTGRILMACIIACLIEIGALVFLHTLKYSSLMISLSYGLVIMTIGVCCLLLTPWANGLLNVSLSWRRS